MGRLIALMLALVAGALVAWTQVRPPSPQPADARATVFSATRAMADVRNLNPTQHPMGSAANHQVRDALMARMAALGLGPRLHIGDVLELARGGSSSGGSPQSLIGVLPGRDHAGPAVALMAHYDSRPGAPGAADDGAGVASALEIVRAVRARGVPARDLVVILTDGEEHCLCGAREVFAHDPIAKRLGFVINLEARGSDGRALMFETGAENGAAIGLFRQSAVRPLAGALFSEVYKRLPNDTDFTISRHAGIAGFNYAFSGGAFDYHSPTDTPANLAPGALQDLGDQALAAAAAAAFAPALPPPRPDVVYGVLFGPATLAYPPLWGWAVLAAGAGLIGLSIVRARRKAPFPWLDMARGAGAGLYALVGAAAVLRLAGVVATFGEGGLGGPLGARRLLAFAHRWEAALLLIAAGFLLFAAAEAARGRRAPAALVPLLAGLASSAMVGRVDAIALGAGAAAALLAGAIGRGPISRPGAWAGVLILGFAAAVAMQIALPLAAYILAWPLLLGAVAAAASDLAADPRPTRLAALAVLAAIGIGWAGVHAHLIVVVVGLPELLCLPVLMALMTVWPLAQPEAGAPPARLPGRLVLTAGAVLVVVVRLANPWDARHPQASFIGYQLDQDAGRAWRVARPQMRTAWSDAALRAEGGSLERLDHWAWNTAMDAAPARPADIPAPAISLVPGGGGLLRLTIHPPPGTRTLGLRLSPDTPARLVQAGAAPADVALPPGRWTRIDWAAPGPEGLTLTIRPGGPGALKIRYAIGLDGWAPGVAPPPAPPPAVMGIGASGQALVTGSRTLAW